MVEFSFPSQKTVFLAVSLSEHSEYSSIYFFNSLKLVISDKLSFSFSSIEIVFVVFLKSLTDKSIFSETPNSSWNFKSSIFFSKLFIIFL